MSWLQQILIHRDDASVHPRSTCPCAVYAHIAVLRLSIRAILVFQLI